MDEDGNINCEKWLRPRAMDTQMIYTTLKGSKNKWYLVKSI